MKTLFSAVLMSAVAFAVLATPVSFSSSAMAGTKKASPCDEIKDKKAKKDCMKAEKAKAKAEKTPKKKS